MDRLPDSTLRRIVVTCLQISAILLLFALPAGAQRQTTVRLWGTGGFGIPKKDATDPFNRANRAVVEAFEKRHPEINLEIINGLEIDGPANDSQMLLAMAGGTAPDVLYVNFRQLVTYVDQDFLYPLDEFIKLDPNVLTRIHKPIRDVITVGGHIYSYPYQQAVQALYYRKDLYRLAGLNPDKPPATWDEFYQYCQALTKPEIGQFGFGFVSDPQSTAYWWINFLWQAGGEPVTQLPNGQWKSTINSPAGVTALEFYRKLVADEWKMPNGNIQRGVTVRTTTLMKDYVEKGRLGMWFQYQTDTIANRATANISPALIGIARMPKGPTGIRANEINAYMYGISALQQDPAVRRAAWEFIKYMGSEEADKVRTEAFVEQGIGSMISPDLLIKYGYEDLVTPQNKQWAESLKALVLTGKPEPHGKNS
ncbi:MAG: sugar ABC transporter substrate-binding protein, partial [Chthonomonadales bacterium]